MADRPKPFDLAKEARRLADAEQVTRHKPAVPPTYPGNLGRLGMGKQRIPPAKPDPLPLAVKSSPEATRVDGYLQPPHGSAPQPPATRSLSPPPAELAPDPQSARQERRRAREMVAEADRAESIAPKAEPVLDSIKIELPANLRGGIGALGKAILGAVVAALLGGGGAVVASQATQVPPAVAECPAQLEQLRARVTRLESRTDRLETESDEARARWRRTNDNVEDALGDVAKLKKRVPEPVTP